MSTADQVPPVPAKSPFVTARSPLPPGLGEIVPEKLVVPVGSDPSIVPSIRNPPIPSLERAPVSMPVISAGQLAGPETRKSSAGPLTASPTWVRSTVPE